MTIASLDMTPQELADLAAKAEHWRTDAALSPQTRLLAASVCEMARDLETTPAPPALLLEILRDLMQHLGDEVARGASRQGTED